MTSLGLVQAFINVFLGLGVGFLWIRLLKPSKDDPRMSRGLQLLQSKIAVLEDLSDRTDHQVKQLTLLLEEKAKDVQKQIEAAQQQIMAVQDSMRKSQEVAKIFQDRIPHEEIIERQNTVKYVRAAQMAHSGASVEEIEGAVGLPRSEVELIHKVNQNRLMFSPQELPAWIQEELKTENAKATNPLEKAYREAFEPPPTPSESLKKLGEEFRKVSRQPQFAEEAAVETIEDFVESVADIPAITMSAPRVTPSNATQTPPPVPAKVGAEAAEKGFTPIRPYQFPRVRT